MSSSKRLILVGAGGFGREILSWIRQGAIGGGQWHAEGFLDDSKLGQEVDGLPVLGGVRTYQPQADDVFCITIGDPKAKLDVYASLKARGAAFASVIHPSVSISQTAAIGEGFIACPGALVSNQAVVGNVVTLNAYSCVGHDATLGDGCTLSSFCDVTGNVSVGEGVFMGSRATILPGFKVGSFATVGAGSVVLRAVQAGTTVFGVPARCIKSAGDE